MRIGDKVYHSKRVTSQNSTIDEYENPTEITTRFNYLTCMGAESRGGLIALEFGETVRNYWTIIANKKYFDNKFKEGDLMWVDGETPPNENELTDEFGYGESATAIIEHISKGNLYDTILLKRNPNRDME